MVRTKTRKTRRQPVSSEWMNPALSEGSLRFVIEMLDSLPWKSHLTTSRLEAVIFVKVYFNQRISCFPSSPGNGPEMQRRLRSVVRTWALFNLGIKICDVYKVYRCNWNVSACLLAFLPRGDLVIREHGVHVVACFPFMASCAQLWAGPLPWAPESSCRRTAAARTKGRLCATCGSPRGRGAKWELRQGWLGI